MRYIESKYLKTKVFRMYWNRPQIDKFIQFHGTMLHLWPIPLSIRVCIIHISELIFPFIFSSLFFFLFLYEFFSSHSGLFPLPWDILLFHHESFSQWHCILCHWHLLSCSPFIPGVLSVKYPLTMEEPLLSTWPVV